MCDIIRWLIFTRGYNFFTKGFEFCKMLDIFWDDYVRKFKWRQSATLWQISFYLPFAIVTQSPRDLHLHFNSLERVLFPCVIWIIDFFSFFNFLSSLKNALLLNLRNLCSRSQQGNGNIEITSLQTSSVFR